MMKRFGFVFSTGAADMFSACPERSRMKHTRYEMQIIDMVFEGFCKFLCIFGKIEPRMGTNEHEFVGWRLPSAVSSGSNCAPPNIGFVFSFTAGSAEHAGR